MLYLPPESEAPRVTRCFSIQVTLPALGELLGIPKGTRVSRIWIDQSTEPQTLSALIEGEGPITLEGHRIYPGTGVMVQIGLPDGSMRYIATTRPPK